MGHSSVEGFAASIPLYVLGAIFLVPLTIGVVLVGRNADRTGRANQISRDLASMYAQGLDFSRSENRRLAMHVAQGLGMEDEQGVVILTKIRFVNAADCGAASRCANQGHAVVTQRYVLGNATLRTSSFGTPARLDPATGNIPDWANDLSARARDFGVKLQPGEFSYAVECYLSSAEAHEGVYSRVMF